MTESELTATPETQDIRPLVGGPVSHRAVWVFGASLAVGVVVLFGALQSHRSAISEPAISTNAEDTGGVIAPAPELVVPPDNEQANAEAPTAYAPQSAATPAISPPVPNLPSRHVVAGPTAPPIAVVTSNGLRDGLAPQAAVSVPPPSPQVVFESSHTRSVPTGDGADTGKWDSRVLAGRFANPATTVPKGTVIQAVLETALDSTRAGFARAIISRDIYGFDGSKILIPKGSRLIGEYKADLASGQSRALIQWQRLMRPDGVIINLDSPSADPLGRAGVEGKVNNHFFAKFGGAILQSALDIGVQVASNRIANGNGTTIYAIPGLYALPGTVQGTSSIASPEKVQPTLTVRQGTSVSVFVARDLDFTSVDQ